MASAERPAKSIEQLWGAWRIGFVSSGILDRPCRDVKHGTLLPDEAEKAGLIDFDDIDIDIKFGGQGEELLRSKRGCLEAVLANDHPITCFFFVDFAQESLCSLKPKPFQAVFPKFLRVGRKKDDAIFPGDTDAFGDELEGIHLESGNPVLDADNRVKSPVKKTHPSGVHFQEKAVPDSLEKRETEF